MSSGEAIARSRGAFRLIGSAAFVAICFALTGSFPALATLSVSDLRLAETPEFASHRKQYEYAAKLAASLTYDTEPQMILDVVALQTQAWIDIGQADKLEALLSAATALAEQVKDPMRLATLRHMSSRAQYYQGDDRAAIDSSTKALDAQRAIGGSEFQHPDPTRLYTQMMDHLAMLQGINREIDAVPLLRIAEKLLPQVRNPTRLSIALDYAYASLLQLLGEHDAAAARLEKALATALDLNDRGWQSELLSAIASTHLLKGEYPRAIKLAQQQLKLAEEDSHTLAMGHATLTLAEAHANQGDYAAAYAYATRSRDYYDSLDDSFTKADARRELARVAALSGRAEDARIVLAEALRLRPENTSAPWRYHIAKVRTAIAIASGDKTTTLRAKAEEDESLSQMQRDATTAQTKVLRDYHQVSERALQLQLLQRESEVRELAMKRDQARILWQRVAIVAILLLLFVTAIAVILLMRRSKSLKRAAETDALTGAQSRAAILAYAHSICVQATARKQHVAACVLDIDHFKRFNDEHGHATGDKILAQCVDAMKRNIRAHDAVGRIGGDEFLIVMEGVDEAAAQARAERILDAVRDVSFEASGHMLRASLSAGVAAFIPTANDTAKSLVQKADAALLRAKQTGKHKVMSYTELSKEPKSNDLESARQSERAASDVFGQTAAKKST
jgi:diguanylate cyclase (GGDEF)-like protein